MTLPLITPMTYLRKERSKLRSLCDAVANDLYHIQHAMIESDNLEQLDSLAQTVCVRLSAAKDDIEKWRHPESPYATQTLEQLPIPEQAQYILADMERQCAALRQLMVPK